MVPSTPALVSTVTPPIEVRQFPVAHHAVLSAKLIAGVQLYCPNSGRDSKRITASRRAALRMASSSILSCGALGHDARWVRPSGDTFTNRATAKTILILLRKPDAPLALSCLPNRG